MAPKGKAPVLIHKAPVAKATPKGLQLSAAQWKAYNAAYSATATALYRQQALQAAALNIRKSRLQAASSLQKITAASHAKARTAAIAAFAVRMSLSQARNAHQNQALVQRVYNDFQRHIQASARAQFVYKGEKAYTHTAVMRTVTSAQAMSLAQAQFNKAIKTAKAAVTSTRTSPAASSVNAAIKAAATAAGLAAANSVPASQKLAAVQAKAKAKAHATAHATASKTAKATAARNRAAKKAAKAAGKPAPRTAPRPLSLERCSVAPLEWAGDPDGHDCVAAAIANSYRLDTGQVLTEQQYKLLVTGLGVAPHLGFAMYEVRRMSKAGLLPKVVAIAPDEPAFMASGHVIGFATPQGPHAAVYLAPGLVITWGEVLPLKDVMVPYEPVEEVWDVQWRVRLE